MMVVKALIRYGANPYEVDDQGDTSVEVASRNETAAGQQNLQDAISMFDARPRASSGARASSGPPPKRARQLEDIDL
jgi:ankyrin repeat protein